MNPNEKKEPKILLELVDDLKNANFVSQNNINGEGRVASLIDEETITNWLKNHPKWSKFYIEVPARKPGDFYLKDDENGLIHVINIKTTKGTTDNATSMLGFIYALTDLTIEELPATATEKTLLKYVNERGVDNPMKDYWFLTFNKNNMNDVFLRGAKQIVNWKANPSNKLQINWKNEWVTEYPDYTYEQSKNNIIGGLKEVWKKVKEKMPQGW